MPFVARLAALALLFAKPAYAADDSAAAYAVGTEILLLLLVGSLVALVARLVQLPYTLALVVAGIGLGFVHIEQLDAFHLDAGILFVFLLPALLFEAAFHLNVNDFVKAARPILTLALPGVAVAVGATAAVSYALIGMTGLRPFGWSDAFLFAAIIAATDPISVLALFKELGVEKKLYVLVEGESLLNDGVAVVVFLIVAAVFGVNVGHGPVPELADASETVVYGVRTFFSLAGGGVLVGVVVGGVGTVLMRQFDDHLVEITLTTVVAYGAFLLAEKGLHVNGVLATVTAGMVVGTWGTQFGMSTRTRLAVEDFWEYAAFVANTFVFLLVGLEIQIADMVYDSVPLAAGFLAVILGRALAVYGLWPFANGGSGAAPGPWRHVLVWGGLKGSLSMVLVLGISPAYEGRDALIRLIFGVVCASLFLQGLTMSGLLRWLGLVKTRSAEVLAYEAHAARLLAASRALGALEDLERRGVIDAETATTLRQEQLQSRATAAAGAAAALAGGEAGLRAERLAHANGLIADHQREALREAGRGGKLGNEAIDAVMRELDARVGGAS